MYVFIYYNALSQLDVNSVLNFSPPNSKKNVALPQQKVQAAKTDSLLNKPSMLHYQFFTSQILGVRSPDDDPQFFFSSFSPE